MKTTFEQRARQARTIDVQPASAPTTPEATGPADPAALAVATQEESVPPAPLPTHGAGFLATQDPDLVRWTLDSHTEGELRGLPYLFDFWAHPHQLPPPGDWRTWVILGGRGAGKTRAGSEWVRAQVEGPRPQDPGRARRVALLAETIDQAREVMVFGDSGLLACSPPDRRPHWHATRRMLEWPNGAVAQLFSAHEPEALRGPQFDCAWADELAKWKKAEEAWDMLQFGLRLDDDPRCVVTTTPRSSPLLLDLLHRPGTVQTHGNTRSNRAFLAKSFLQDVQARYGNTRLGKQELDGLILEDIEGALWSWDLVNACKDDSTPPFDRVVVAVDPAVSMGKGSDSTGIVAVGAVTRGH
ncbi:MAG TPA: terminase family protein, partial [Rubellimicrobium sp.]|nr:terminase family protein [Rubellimicrobium sp.]